jgi:hypothetical protein
MARDIAVAQIENRNVGQFGQLRKLRHGRIRQKPRGKFAAR